MVSVRNFIAGCCVGFHLGKLHGTFDDKTSISSTTKSTISSII